MLLAHYWWSAEYFVLNCYDTETKANQSKNKIDLYFNFFNYGKIHFKDIITIFGEITFPYNQALPRLRKHVFDIFRYIALQVHIV